MKKCQVRSGLSAGGVLSVAAWLCVMVAAAGPVRAEEVARLTAAAPNENVYRMKENDTLRDLAARFLGNAEYLPELMAFNRITNPLLVKDGAFIAIPGPERKTAMDEIDRARGLATVASEAMAQDYANKEFGSARRHLDEAVAARWRAAYHDALRLARTACEEAAEAKKLADERAPVPEAGKVTAVYGPVQIAVSADASFQPAEVGDTLPVQGTLRTGPRARAEVTLADGSVVRVLPDSVLKIADYRRDRRDGARTSELDVIMGNILGDIKPRKKKGSSYKVKTSGAAMAIRGTTLRVGRDAEDTTRLAVLKGNVDLGSEKGQVPVPDNFGSYVKKGGKPAAAIALLPPPEIISPREPDPVSAQQCFPFSWHALGARRFGTFHVEVARDPKFNAVIDEAYVGTPGYTTAPLQDGAYYWRVSTVDNKGLEGRTTGGRIQIRRKLGMALKSVGRYYQVGNSWRMEPGGIVEAVPTAEGHSIVAVDVSYDGETFWRFWEERGRFALKQRGSYVLYARGIDAFGNAGPVVKQKVRVTAEP